MIVQHRRNITPYPPLLVSVLLGQDATLCDKIVRVSSEPILVSIANIKYNKIKNNKAWFCVGFLPSYPKTKLDSQKDANRIATKELSNEFYHSCISFILDELIQVQKRNGIKMMVNVNGHICMSKCYFEVAFYLGDASGKKKLCGHYNNFSGNIARKKRECKISHMNSDKLNHECQMNIGEYNIKDKVTRSVQSIKRKENVAINRSILKNISKNAVIPAHFHLSYGDNSGGIYTATPPGVLHVIC